MVTLGVYLLGMADIVYKLNFVESFAFGSLISAVDPVATLAIFQGSRLAVWSGPPFAFLLGNNAVLLDNLV